MMVELGMPVTLAVLVEDEEIVVSGVLGELFRAQLGADVPKDGAFGLVRVPYRLPPKSGPPRAMEFSNLVVEDWE